MSYFALVASLEAKVDACGTAVNFSTKQSIQYQHLKLSPTVTMDFTQKIAKSSSNGVVIASNVICQKLNGAAYTGSVAEWKKFIDSGVSGLIKTGFTNLSFTNVGTDDKVYKGSLDNQEYIFIGTVKGNVQHIYNVAILDKAINTVYTLSVSGNEAKKDDVRAEFERLVASFKPQS